MKQGGKIIKVQTLNYHRAVKKKPTKPLTEKYGQNIATVTLIKCDTRDTEHLPFSMQTPEVLVWSVLSVHAKVKAEQMLINATQ